MKKVGKVTVAKMTTAPKVKKSAVNRSAVVKKVAHLKKAPANSPMVSSDPTSRVNKSRAGFDGGLSNTHKYGNKKFFSK
jgi:hypothetical protein